MDILDNLCRPSPQICWSPDNFFSHDIQMKYSLEFKFVNSRLSKTIYAVPIIIVSTFQRP